MSTLIQKQLIDEGQFRISTTCVLCEQNNEVRARLVARGYDETTVTQNDSPTISKSVMRLFIAISLQHHSKIKTTDIKSTFLELTRDVYIQLPKEEGVTSGHIWKIKHCLYGPSEAARQFYESVNLMLLHQVVISVNQIWLYLFMDTRINYLVSLYCMQMIFFIPVIINLKRIFYNLLLKSSQLVNQMRNNLIMFVFTYCKIIKPVSLCDCNWTRTKNQLVLKRTLNHLVLGSSPVAVT